MGEHLLARVVHWLRAGYPQGIPSSDYVALLGVLHRNLTEAEVEQVARALRDGEGGLDAGVSDERIAAVIRAATLETPGEDDVRRVQSRLAAGGWELGHELGRD